ncbi:MAG: hypothetical protein CMC99_05215, partial [Flavobacteriales bacterium]|nr:hypothetical protein [Flavobacteriales bacterium]
MPDTRFPLAALPSAAISSVFSNFDELDVRDNKGVQLLVREFSDCILGNPALKTEAACCIEGDVEILKKFMYEECHQDHCADLSAVLIYHSKNNNIECVRTLLGDNGSNRAKPDAYGSYALKIAAGCGHIGVVKLLLDDNREHRALPD